MPPVVHPVMSTTRDIEATEEGLYKIPRNYIT